MTQNQPQQTIITSEGNSIIIAQPPAKEETNYLDILKGFFKKDPVSTEIQKESVKAFGDDAYIPPQEGQKCTWTNLLNWQKRSECKNLWQCKCTEWKDLDVKVSNQITKFKEENILPLGDIRIRSIVMAFSSALLYKLISFNTKGLLRKTRNLGLSFVFMGYWFVPQLINPFLKRQNIVENVV